MVWDHEVAGSNPVAPNFAMTIDCGEYFNGLLTLPRIQGREPDGERTTTGMYPHDGAVIRSCLAPSASGSVVESTLATAVSRGRRFRPPDRRKGISSAQ